MIKLNIRATTEDRNPLLRLRMRETVPDPDFRAVLRERLMTAASDRREDHRIPGRSGEHRMTGD